MGLLQLPQKRSDGIEFIDQRAGLYYTKYRYRARFYCKGVTLCWFCKNESDVKERAAKHKKRWQNADIPTVVNFLKWKLEQEQFKGPNRKATVRIEGDVAAAFSNNLDLLKTLENLGAVVDYTEVDNSVPEGIKYFVKEPKFKYRFYLKSKRVPDDFSEKLSGFFKRYEGTTIKMSPSPALTSWLIPSNSTQMVGWYNWKKRYCCSNFFVDYDDESTLTLFMLMFDGMISRRFKLEKRPD